VTIKADIKFCDGSTHRCVGRVINGKSVPWTDADDVKRHVAFIGSKFEGFELVRVIEND